jgi:hypothetical protein
MLDAWMPIASPPSEAKAFFDATPPPPPADPEPAPAQQQPAAAHQQQPPGAQQQPPAAREPAPEKPATPPKLGDAAEDHRRHPAGGPRRSPRRETRCHR